jgi:hypothetical protein
MIYMILGAHFKARVAQATRPAPASMQASRLPYECIAMEMTYLSFETRS